MKIPDSLSEWRQQMLDYKHGAGRQVVENIEVEERVSEKVQQVFWPELEERLSGIPGVQTSSETNANAFQEAAYKFQLKGDRAEFEDKELITVRVPSRETVDAEMEHEEFGGDTVPFAGEKTGWLKPHDKAIVWATFPSDLHVERESFEEILSRLGMEKRGSVIECLVYDATIEKAFCPTVLDAGLIAEFRPSARFEPTGLTKAMDAHLEGVREVVHANMEIRYTVVPKHKSDD